MLIDDIISEDVERISEDFDSDLFKGSKILVSGGAGFLGSYLCDVFARLNADVTCLDNFSTGTRENVSHLTIHNRFKIIEADVSKFKSRESFDYIFHFASRASPMDYQAHPTETLLTNSLGSYKILEHGRRNGSRIILASTSEVYGDSEKLPTPENYWGKVNPIGIRSCYDEGKRFSEALFMAYHREHASDVRIVRIYNTYGPRMRPDELYGRAVPRFILQALNDCDITVYGDGSQTRSFGYVSDTLRGILSVSCNDEANGKVFNIGNPQETTIIDLAKKVKEITGSKSKIVFCPLPEDDPRRRKPEIKKAIKELGWYPKVILEEGLARTIKWFSGKANER